MGLPFNDSFIGAHVCVQILSQLEQACFRLLECCCLPSHAAAQSTAPLPQARKLRAELQKKGVSAPAATSAPAAAAADTTAAAVAAAVTAALKAAPVAAVAPAPAAAAAAAVPATSARSSFNPADLDRYAELQQKTREMQGLQVGAGGDLMQLGAAL